MIKIVVRRFITVTLAIYLALIAGGQPCVAMFAESESAHDCCDDSKQESSHHDASPCGAICAAVENTFKATDTPTTDEQSFAIAIERSGVPNPPATTPGRSWGSLKLPDLEHGPPLFLLNAAFLI